MNKTLEEITQEDLNNIINLSNSSKDPEKIFEEVGQENLNKPPSQFDLTFFYNEIPKYSLQALKALALVLSRKKSNLFVNVQKLVAIHLKVDEENLDNYLKQVTGLTLQQIIDLPTESQSKLGNIYKTSFNEFKGIEIDSIKEANTSTHHFNF